MSKGERGIRVSEGGYKSEKSERSEGVDKRKQSLYFPEEMLKEIKDEAERLDRSMSWVVQRAWKLSRAELATLPSVTNPEGVTE